VISPCDFRESHGFKSSVRIAIAMTVFFCAAISLRAQTSVEIDLEEQRVYLLQNGRVALASPISSGRYGHLTEKGSFKVLEKERTHYSSMYGKIVDSRGNTIVADADADMPVPAGGKFIPAPMHYFMRFAGADGMHAADTAAITEQRKAKSERLCYDRCSGAVLSTLFALAVFGPRVRSTRSAKMFSASSRSGSIAGVLVSSSAPPAPPIKSVSASEAASGSTLGVVPFFFASANFPGYMINCRFGLSTVSSVTR